MTRINLVPVRELTDQHLFAEFREIKMVPKSLRRSLLAKVKLYGYGRTAELQLLHRIPKAYTLNTGHVSFFYDKGAYLFNRYDEIREELTRRGFNFNVHAQMDPDGVFDSLDHNFNNYYSPTPEALAIIRSRIAEKIAMKPSWYRYEGKPLENSFAVR